MTFCLEYVLVYVLPETLRPVHEYFNYRPKHGHQSEAIGVALETPRASRSGRGRNGVDQSTASVGMDAPGKRFQARLGFAAQTEEP